MENIVTIFYHTGYEHSFDTEAFIQEIYQKYTSNTHVEMGKTPYGKPYILNDSLFHFNISHADNLILCAVCDQEIGIDVERIYEFDKRFIERYFCPEEQAFLKESDDPYIIQQRATEIWTRKESYLKMTGVGIRISLNMLNTLELRCCISFLIDSFYIVTIAIKKQKLASYRFVEY